MNIIHQAEGMGTGDDSGHKKADDRGNFELPEQDQGKQRQTQQKHNVFQEPEFHVSNLYFFLLFPDFLTRADKRYPLAAGSPDHDALDDRGVDDAGGLPPDNEIGAKSADRVFFFDVNIYGCQRTDNRRSFKVTPHQLAVGVVIVDVSDPEVRCHVRVPDAQGGSELERAFFRTGKNI
jgi:hypothetical protein